MSLKIIGNRIKLLESIPSDIDKIMEFENVNKEFVHHYSKEKHLALLKDKDCLHLSIRRIDNDKLIGHMILFGLESNSNILEFRRLTIDEKGQGFGRETIQLLKKLCFEKLKFHRLWFDVYDDNPRAINLYESEGFVKEGVLRDHIKTSNGYRSQRIYALLENEYKTI